MIERSGQESCFHERKWYGLSEGEPFQLRLNGRKKRRRMFQKKTIRSEEDLDRRNKLHWSAVKLGH